MSAGNLIEFSPPFEQKLINLEDSRENNHCNDTPITTESFFKDHFIQIDTPSSFSCLNVTDDVFNCNLDILKHSGRESLLFDVSGRDSLGVLKLENLNLSFQTTPNKIEPYNNALLHPYSFRNQLLSTTSTNSSILITPSNFNSGSLECSEPSKIFTPSHFDVSSSSDLLNEGFLNTVSSFQGCSSKIFTEHRTRIMSLPNMNQKLIDIGENFEGEDRKLKSESDLIAIEELITINDEDDNVFDNDLVLIEAHHITAKIQDGSILCASFEESILDSTAPPEFTEIDEETPITPVKGQTDIFKNIDKLVPPQDKVIERQTDKEEEAEEAKNTLTNINQNQNVSANQSKFSISHNSRTSSKDANEILQNLSVIINNENRDLKQSIEGQQLLLNLADILYSDGSKGGSTDDANSLNDSGHSSFEQVDQQEYPSSDAALDLRVKSCKSNDENFYPSILKREKASCGRLSQSYQFCSSLVPKNLYDGLKKKIVSTKSLDFDSKDGSDSLKLKTKKIETKSFEKKKGPLKALIPLGSMLKSSEISVNKQSLNMKTPSKIEPTSLDLFKNKRTSTPIADPHIKPMAQSTPEATKPVYDKPISCSSQLKKRKFICPVSPLARPNSMTANSVNSSSFAQNTSANLSRDSSIPVHSSMSRRHSATDLKINSPKVSKLKRNNSIGKSFKVQSEISRAKENSSSAVLNVTPMKSFIRRHSISKNILQDKNFVIKSKNVFNRMKERKVEKENIY